jgi:hypothetical protein
MLAFCILGICLSMLASIEGLKRISIGLPQSEIILRRMKILAIRQLLSGSEQLLA